MCRRRDREGRRERPRPEATVRSSSVRGQPLRCRTKAAEASMPGPSAFRRLREEGPSPREVFEMLTARASRLLPLLSDIGAVAREHLRSGRSLLAEGAHGALLDLAAGTYPFVTASACSAAGLASGLGIAPRALSESLVVLKAYTTRVGSGPFPTELSDETGEYLRKRGNEFGTTTGRPRRTGWFD